MGIFDDFNEYKQEESNYLDIKSFIQISKDNFHNKIIQLKVKGKSFDIQLPTSFARKKQFNSLYKLYSVLIEKNQEMLLQKMSLKDISENIAKENNDNKEEESFEKKFISFIKELNHYETAFPEDYFKLYEAVINKINDDVLDYDIKDVNNMNIINLNKLFYFFVFTAFVIMKF